MCTRVCSGVSFFKYYDRKRISEGPILEMTLYVPVLAQLQVVPLAVDRRRPPAAGCGRMHCSLCNRRASSQALSFIKKTHG